MRSGGKPRWKISSLLDHLSPAASTTRTRTTPPPEPPLEFVCPISGRLMADPVILPSGRTFDRACVQACHHVGVAPPEDEEGAHHPLLIPNMALKAAIHTWCDSLGLQRPLPLDPAAALHLARGLSVASPSSTSTASSFFTATTTVATSTFTTSSFSSSSSEIVSSADSQCPPPKTAAFSTGSSTLALEEEILAGLGHPQVSEQESALLLLRSATRDGGGDSRAALCTPRMLAALRRALLSHRSSLQAHAAASLLNLSLHPPNRTRVVRAGAVPAIVDALKCGNPDAQDHAAGALFSLAVDDNNKAAIGALGALPPLLHLLCRPSGGERARRDAAMALYHLSMAVTNRAKLLKLGAVRTLLGLATRPKPPDGPAALPGIALMVLCNLAGSGEGRDAMMEVGAVEALVGLLKAAPRSPGRRDPASDASREHCVAALYWMSRGSMRFRGLARAAGAEEVLRAVVEQEESVVAEVEDRRRWRTREMAKRALRAAEGGGGRDEGAFGGVSEPALRAKRRPVHVPGANSTKF